MNDSHKDLNSSIKSEYCLYPVCNYLIIMANTPIHHFHLSLLKSIHLASLYYSKGYL